MRTGANKEKIKASRKAYETKLRDSDQYQAKRKAWNFNRRGCVEEQAKLNARAKAKYFKRQTEWKKNEEVVRQITERVNDGV